MSDLRIELDEPAQKEGVKLAMITWQKEARRICPKQTHAMKTSIVFNVNTDRNGFKAVIGTFGGRLRNSIGFHYPFAVHNGVPSAKSSKRRKGMPFFDISYATKRETMNKQILNGLKLK